MTRITPLVLMSALLVFVDTGCRPGSAKVKTDADFDPALARASAERPSSTVVEYISIPPDPSRPIWIVAVEPFKVAASGVTSGSGWQPILDPTQHLGAGIAAQLLSALNRTGNVVVIDYETYCRDPGKIASQLKPGELGPFVIKGTVTEFNETAELSSQGQSSVGSKTGRIMSHLPVMGVNLAGHLISEAEGSKAVNKMNRTGLVGFDIQIIDQASGRLLGSFVAEGAFVAVDVTRAKSKFGKTETSSDYASSAIGQAQRVAVNNAIQSIYSILSQSNVQ